MIRPDQPPSPVPVSDQVQILPGPALLAGAADGPTLAAHHHRYGPPPSVDLDSLADLVTGVGLRGRGGAAFPFGTKLRTAASASRQAGRRSVVVVNFSEGEPASAKDSALALSRPHLVLDGAVATAQALGADEVHLVLPGDRPAAHRQVCQAVAERADLDRGVRLRQHTAGPRFVSGQARAVVELMSGRPGLPVTAWVPEAVSGYRDRPTLLSNAETWAEVGLLLHVGRTAYSQHGTPDEPGTTLLTVTRQGSVPQVHEVPFGTRLVDVLPSVAPGSAVLVGGFHGTWARVDGLADARVGVEPMAALGLPLGAGVVHVLDPDRCLLAFTSAVVDYLAGQSAGRCGPCVHGLPALATAVRAALAGYDATDQITRLDRLLTRRGACAHPDGTVRMVRSALVALPDEIAAHRQGRCRAHQPTARRSAVGVVS